jgi:predicted RNase H-like nuclease (RuvC/YqgF family)
MQSSLVEQRDAELVNMQTKLRNTETQLDELMLSCGQQIRRYGAELANVRAEMEAKKSELEAVRLRLTYAEDGWANSKAKADKLHTVTAASLVDLNEDRDMCEELKEDMQELASPQWNERSIEAMNRNEG